MGMANTNRGDASNQLLAAQFKWKVRDNIDLNAPGTQDVVKVRDPEADFRERKTKERQARLLRKQQQGEEGLNSNPLDFDMLTARKEVQNFGKSGMSDRAKKKLEVERIKALGGKAQKAQNHPYHIAKGMRKKQLEREEKHKQRVRELGVGLSKHSALTNVTEKRHQRGDRGLVLRTPGRFANGTLHLGKKDIANITADRMRSSSGTDGVPSRRARGAAAGKGGLTKGGKRKKGVGRKSSRK
eukprot:Clim_evm8s214 gene=Clim_evmTU8s214